MNDKNKQLLLILIFLGCLILPVVLVDRVLSNGFTCKQAIQNYEALYNAAYTCANSNCVLSHDILERMFRAEQEVKEECPLDVINNQTKEK